MIQTSDFSSPTLAKISFPSGPAVVFSKERSELCHVGAL